MHDNRYNLFLLQKDTLQSAVELLDETTISTAFSGIDAPGTGLEMAILELSHRVGRSIPPPKHLQAIEWFTESQYELMIHPNAPSCIFNDISEFLVKGVRPLARQLRGPATAQVLGPVIKTGRAIAPSAYCIRHKCMCELQCARIHIAGTPCTDFSKMGQQKEVSGGTTLHLLVWIGMRLKLQESVIIQENVVAFDTGFMAGFLGSLYYLDVAVENSLDFGFPVRRERKWTIMRHKVKTLSQRHPLNVFTRMFYRVARCNWNAFLRSTPEEIQAELDAGLALRKWRLVQRGVRGSVRHLIPN